jgi:hypothetical protein
MPQRSTGYVNEQRFGRLTAVVLAPSHLARVLVQVNADPVMLPDISASEPLENDSA